MVELHTTLRVNFIPQPVADFALYVMFFYILLFFYKFQIADGYSVVEPFLVVDRGIGSDACRALFGIDFKQLNRVLVVAVKTAQKACDDIKVFAVIGSPVRAALVA